jgi:DNA polymerase
MDARERLRAYLEQRREMGESEFVLDSLSVDDVLRVLGDKQPAPSSRPRAASDGHAAPSTRDTAPATSGNWRDALTSIGAEAPSSKSAPQGAPRPAAPAVTQAPDAAPVETSAPLPGAGLIVGSAMGDLPPGPLAQLATLDDVAAHVASCRGCTLYQTAKNHVPGEGNPTAGFVCVGEAPGQTEDEQGRPFVGRAGELLTKILEAIAFKREDVFICNVLKHRPPGNRNPAPDEIKACSPYLMRQLELLRPRVILALGTFAAQTLLQTTTPIGKLRGQVHRFHGIPLIVTYHPAALLRNPAWKRPTWEDVQLARRIFDSAAQG